MPLKVHSDIASLSPYVPGKPIEELQRELGLSRGDVEDDLRHMIRSALAAGHRVVVVPARCRTCGFIFGEEKVTKPGKCPECRGSRILEPQIGIEPKG